MDNQLKYKGYYGSAEISMEDNILHGKLECINDLVTYEAKTVPELEFAFKEAVDDYLATCEELGKVPDKTMSGSFNVRIGPVLHKQAWLAAKSRKLTLNDFVKKAIETSLSEKKEFHFKSDKINEKHEIKFSSSDRDEVKSRWQGSTDTRKKAKWN